MTSEQIEVAKIVIGIFTLITTIVIATFAYQLTQHQAETARNKLKYDLYDRRFEIYEAAVKLVIELEVGAAVGTVYKHSNVFAKRQRHATFLLNEEIIDELISIKALALTYTLKQKSVNSFFEQFGSDAAPNEQIANLIKEIEQHKLDATILHTSLVIQFRKVLDFRKLV